MDELFNLEIFTTLTEVKILIEQWRKEYNQVRPNSSLGYQRNAELSYSFCYQVLAMSDIPKAVQVVFP